MPDFKVIPRGKEGEWDSIALLQGHAFANVGDKTYLWYSHWDCEGQFRNQEIGLATLRRDGFGYLVPRHAGRVGPLDHRPASNAVRPSASALRLTWKESRQAPLTVELLDDRDRPIPGFRGAMPRGS